VHHHFLLDGTDVEGGPRDAGGVEGRSVGRHRDAGNDADDRADDQDFDQREAAIGVGMGRRG
jgi:hypothetical protein